MAAALRPLGLTHVQFVLLASTWWLGTRGRQPSQRELADHAGTNIMMTSQVLRALESKGLVERSQDPRDTRALRLAVTPSGQRIAIKAVQAVEAADRRYFSPIENQGWLLDALRQMAGRSSSGELLEEPEPHSSER